MRFFSALSSVSLLLAAVTSGFEVSEILMYTGRGWWAPGENGAVYYRLGCGNILAKSSGVKTKDFKELGGAQLENTFGIYNFDGDGWIHLNASIDKAGVSSDSKRVRFEGCGRPDYVELAYFATNGWELGGLSVVVDDHHFTFLPETAFPKLHSPYNDYDSIYLDMDDSDPVVRLALSRACDVTIEVDTGESGVWAPGENGNLHYKLLDASGNPVAPARGPPRGNSQWEPPHIPLDDSLSFAVYGGLWSRSLDWLHLDGIDVEMAGATSRMTDASAWDCGGSFANAEMPRLGGVELIYGNTTNGWEMTKFRAQFQGSSYEAILATEYPKVFASYDTDSVVFFDYGGSACATNTSNCESDWYMRFELRDAITTCGHSNLQETWKTTDVKLECTVFVHDKLTIVPGTSVVVADSLVVLPGAQLFATGTRENPITFWAGPEVVQAAGMWQGIVLLGKATHPGTSRSGYRYGDEIPDESSSSGALEYVRIYGGGTTASLVLAGVANTPVHHVEIGYGSQDGLLIEDGEAEIHHLSVFQTGDDAVDLESGCEVQLHQLFLFTDEVGDHAIEIDDGVVFEINDSTIISTSATASTFEWRGTPGPRSAVSNTFVHSQYPFANDASCSLASTSGNVFTVSIPCEYGIVEEDATIAKLSRDFVVDIDFKIDPRPNPDYGAGAFAQDPFEMWLEQWSILHELKKLDIYEDLATTPAAPTLPTPAPTLDEETSTSPPIATSKKKGGAAGDEQGETAAIAFLTGIIVGAVAVFVTICMTRSNSYLGWPLTIHNTNPAQLERPSIPGSRRQYETLGVELMTSPPENIPPYEEVDLYT